MFINLFKVRLVWFVALCCVGMLALFQKPLLDYALPVSDLPSLQGLAQIATVEMVQIGLLAFFLFLLSMAGSFILKTAVSLTFLINAAALYFMVTYQIEIDRTMVANILNTDTRESTELFHPSLLLYLFGYGLIPALLIWKTKIIMPRWYWRIFGSIMSIALLFGWLFVTAFTWLWFDQHASRLGSKVLPWSYIVNTARHISKQRSDNREQVLLPDAQFDHEPDKKEIVVLVIGEAARADHWQYYGYGRDTNPFTSQLDISVFPIGDSCATNTIGSTACIVTHEGRKASASTHFEPLQSYLTRSGVETIYRTNNSGPPPMKVTRRETAREIASTCTGTDCPVARLDESLNWGLIDELTASTANRIFVTLHQSGSHGPAYWTKYAEGFEEFTPVCKTVQIAKCTLQEVRNAYDNTLRYTDYLMADLITSLSQMKDVNAAVIYVSDHGQSLGENGLFLHGAPMAVAPEAQRLVPFMVWMSDGFKTSRGVTADSIVTKESYPHDFPFHSVMGAFGMRSDIYKPQFDVFNTTEKGPKR